MELLSPLPVQPVQRRGGAVAVALPFFGAGKLLARLPERQPHAGEVDARRQAVLGQRSLVHRTKLRALVPHHQQLVPQGEVVVGGNIAHDLPRRVGRELVAAAPRRHRPADIPETAGSAFHVARFPRVEAAALDGVTGVVAEDADPVVQHGEVIFVGLVPAQGTSAALPRLAVHQDIPPAGELVQLGPQQVHRLHIVQAHQVEPEAVDVVFLRPVEHRVDHIPPGHGPLAGELVAAAAAVGKAAVLVLAEIIERHHPVQHIVGAVHVVIDHIHHHADARRVEGLDHLLALPHPDFAAGGVGGVAALRHIEVGGVVAPVVLPGQRAALVHAAEVKDGHELDIAHPQPLEIVQAGGVDAVAVQGRSLLGKGQKFAPPCVAHTAGRVLRKVPDVDLPDAPLRRRDGRSAVVLPAGRVGTGGVEDHAPLPVHPRRAGVGVGGGAAAPLGRHREIIVASVLVAGQIDAPDPLPPRAEGQRADADPAAAFSVKVYADRLSRGGPQPQMGARRGILGPQRPLIAVLPRKVLAFKDRLPLC